MKLVRIAFQVLLCVSSSRLSYATKRDVIITTIPSTDTTPGSIRNSAGAIPSEVESDYDIWYGGSAGECPEGLEVSQSECLEAGNEVTGLNQAQLDVGSWDNTPCGCFVGTDEAVLFKDKKYGTCQQYKFGQPVCRKTIKPDVSGSFPVILGHKSSTRRLGRQG